MQNTIPPSSISSSKCHRCPHPFSMAMVVIAATIALVLTGLGNVPLAAEDWPQWRGPQRDGTWTPALTA